MRTNRVRTALTEFNKARGYNGHAPFLLNSTKGENMDSKFIALLKSRKFWAAVVGLAFVFLNAYVPNFPLGEDAVLNLVLTIVAYILGTAIEDGLRSQK